MILGSGFLAQKFVSAENLANAAKANLGKALTWTRRFKWVGFAIVPSSLMLGVTAHLTSNVASAPFLWVLPLAIYLLTFIIAFSPRPPIPFTLISNIFPFAAIGGLILTSSFVNNYVLDIVGNLLCFFIITQMCHNRLAEDRPPSEHLTEFYFFMSLGGVIGGALTALAAPLLFNDVYEYHLMLAASGLVAAGAFPARNKIAREVMMIFAIILATVCFIAYAQEIPATAKNIIAMIIVSGLAAGIVLHRKVPLRLFAYLTAVSLLAINVATVFSENRQEVIYSGRSFFGVSKVIYKETDNGPMHIFKHGNTKHNIQLRSQEALDFPLAYYAPNGSFGQAVEAIRTVRSEPAIAVIGLGAGAMACHEKQDESWKYYEIDPLVVDMARNQSLFTYVNNCAPDSPIIIGDARLTLQNEAAASFDLIMIDAFSSNVIPAHLVTLEAMSLYRTKLKPGGAIFFHTSNRYLDVTSVVLNAAEAAGLATRSVFTRPADNHIYKEQITPSRAVLVAGSDAELDAMLANHPDWKVTEGKESVGIWRDDFSHVLGALLAKL